MTSPLAHSHLQLTGADDEDHVIRDHIDSISPEGPQSVHPRSCVSMPDTTMLSLLTRLKQAKQLCQLPTHVASSSLIPSIVTSMPRESTQSSTQERDHERLSQTLGSPTCIGGRSTGTQQRTTTSPRVVGSLVVSPSQPSPDSNGIKQANMSTLSNTNQYRKKNHDNAKPISEATSNGNLLLSPEKSLYSGNPTSPRTRSRNAHSSRLHTKTLPSEDIRDAHSSLPQATPPVSHASPYPAAPTQPTVHSHLSPAVLAYSPTAAHTYSPVAAVCPPQLPASIQDVHPQDTQYGHPSLGTPLSPRHPDLYSPYTPSSPYAEACIPQSASQREPSLFQNGNILCVPLTTSTLPDVIDEGMTFHPQIMRNSQLLVDAISELQIQKVEAEKRLHDLQSKFENQTTLLKSARDVILLAEKEYKDLSDQYESLKMDHQSEQDEHAIEYRKSVADLETMEERYNNERNLREAVEREVSELKKMLSYSRAKQEEHQKTLRRMMNDFKVEMRQVLDQNTQLRMQKDALMEDNTRLTLENRQLRDMAVKYNNTCASGALQRESTPCNEDAEMWKERYSELQTLHTRTITELDAIKVKAEPSMQTVGKEILTRNQETAELDTREATSKEISTLTAEKQHLQGLVAERDAAVQTLRQTIASLTLERQQFADAITREKARVDVLHTRVSALNASPSPSNTVPSPSNVVPHPSNVYSDVILQLAQTQEQVRIMTLREQSLSRLVHDLVAAAKNRERMWMARANGLSQLFDKTAFSHE